jgi:hypothetical protein
MVYMHTHAVTDERAFAGLGLGGLGAALLAQVPRAALAPGGGCGADRQVHRPPPRSLLKRELAEVTAERNQNLLYYLWKKDAASHMEVSLSACHPAS